jgi:hypothetical protein
MITPKQVFPFFISLIIYKLMHCIQPTLIQTGIGGMGTIGLRDLAEGDNIVEALPETAGEAVHNDGTQG